MSVRDEDFAYFLKKFGEATYTDKVPESSIQKFKGILPDQLLEYWRLEGWSAYANGLMWTVNPEDYSDLVQQWLEGTHYPKIDKYHCIARTAFGVLYVWGEKYNQWFTISCPTNVIVAFDKKLFNVNPDPDHSIKSFFASASAKARDLKDLNSKVLTPQSFKKLGHLKPNEVYAFAPALVAGGSPVVDNVEKEDLFIHLSILREMASPTLPYSGLDIDQLIEEQQKH